MARDPSFPPPLSELAESGIGVAAAPSGGMGLALDSSGNIPSGVLFVGSLAAMKISVGHNSAHFAATDLASFTVPHNLGKVPVVVLATSEHQNIIASIVSWDTVNVTIQGEQKDGVAFTGDINFNWIAIG
jgi:hypothetical protein